MTHQWTREGLAWATGLFEGEGCIGHNKKTGQWQLIVASTDEDVLKRLLEVTGLGTLRGPVNRGHKPYWIWNVTRREHVYALLAAMTPWLGARRKERAFESISSMNDQMDQTCQRGHRWTGKSSARRSYEGRVRRVCKSCLADGVLVLKAGAI